MPQRSPRSATNSRPRPGAVGEADLGRPRIQQLLADDEVVAAVGKDDEALLDEDARIARAVDDSNPHYVSS